MLLIEQARKGTVTPEMEKVAAAEGVSTQFLLEEIAQGRVIIPVNKNHRAVTPFGIGGGLATKINANIGTSKDCSNLDEELKKLDVAIAAGAHTVMDLSTGGDIDAIRREVLRRSTVPIGTVPLYQAAIESARQGKKIVDMTVEDIFRVIEKQAQDGVDFVTVHCGLTRAAALQLKNEGRIMNVVSRGGSFTVAWMIHNKKENPLYEYYDRLLEIAAAYDLTLSLGDGMRPGCIADATDRCQIQELITLGELAQRAIERGVQVMIEGPGHVPIDQIAANMLLQKRLCHGAPFYVLGPLVTDAAPGYDHITSAIGGAIAAMSGADFLCYVTPSEHLRLPTIEDVREGVIASKIAAHAGDIAKGNRRALERDRTMAQYRKKLDWEGQIATALDPERARAMRDSRKPADSDVCTMCGEFCANKGSFNLFGHLLDQTRKA
jgi:phosphomethylpyrimidine synthase